jgi:hypothetical protein
MCSAVRLCDCSDGVQRRQLKAGGNVLRCCWCGITRSSRFRLAASCRNLQLIEASDFAVPESEIVCSRCTRRADRQAAVRRVGAPIVELEIMVCSWILLLVSHRLP